MFGVGRHEHHDRRPFERRQQVEPVATPELDVEKDHLRPGPFDLADGIADTLGLADDLDPGMRGQQAAHRLARQMLVVDDQDAEHGSPSSTSAATTLLPTPSRVKLWRPG